MQITIRQVKFTLCDSFKIPERYLSRLIPKLTPNDSELLKVCAAIDTGLDVQTACHALKVSLPTDAQMRTFTRNLAQYIAAIATARGDNPNEAMSALFNDTEGRS